MPPWSRLRVSALQARVTDYTSGQDAALALIRPVFADLSGLPPLIIQAGTHEVLLDDAVRLARQATNADVEVTLDITPRVPHVFQAYYPILDEGAAALDSAGRFLSVHLAGGRTRHRRAKTRPQERDSVTPTPPSSTRRNRRAARGTLTEHRCRVVGDSEGRGDRDLSGDRPPASKPEQPGSQRPPALHRGVRRLRRQLYGLRRRLSRKERPPRASARCIRLNLDCADACYATGRVVTRQTSPDLGSSGHRSKRVRRPASRVPRSAIATPPTTSTAASARRSAAAANRLAMTCSRRSANSMSGRVSRNWRADTLRGLTPNLTRPYEPSLRERRMPHSG